MGSCRKDITKSGLRSSPHTERHQWTSCNWKGVLVGALSKRRIKIDCKPSLSPSSFSGRPVLTATCSQSLSSHLTLSADDDNAIFVLCHLPFWPSSCRVVLARRGGLAIIALTSRIKPSSSLFPAPHKKQLLQTLEHDRCNCTQGCTSANKHVGGSAVTCQAFVKTCLCMQV